MKRVFADLPDDLLIELKVHCIRENVSQKAFMEKLIRDALGKPFAAKPKAAKANPKAVKTVKKSTAKKVTPKAKEKK